MRSGGMKKEGMGRAGLGTGCEVVQECGQNQPSSRRKGNDAGRMCGKVDRIQRLLVYLFKSTTIVLGGKILGAREDMTLLFSGKPRNYT